MKKLLIIIITMFLLSGCALIDSLVSAPDRVTKDWQPIDIYGLGTFRLPTEWYVENQDGILYITDKPRENGNYKIYIVGLSNRIGFPVHEIFEGIERGETIRAIGSSTRPADLLFVEYIVNGFKQEHYVINFNNGRSHERQVTYSMLVWNREVVDDWHAEQIMWTFSSTRDDFDVDSPNVGLLSP